MNTEINTFLKALAKYPDASLSVDGSRLSLPTKKGGCFHIFLFVSIDKETVLRIGATDGDALSCDFIQGINIPSVDFLKQVLLNLYYFRINFPELYEEITLSH